MRRGGEAADGAEDVSALHGEVPRWGARIFTLILILISTPILTLILILILTLTRIGCMVRRLRGEVGLRLESWKEGTKAAQLAQLRTRVSELEVESYAGLYLSAP